MSRCRSCSAPVEWALTDNGRRMPLDLGLWPDGRVVVVGKVRDENGRPSPMIVSLTADQLARLRAAAERDGYEVEVRRSHFQTCRDADVWRG